MRDGRAPWNHEIEIPNDDVPNNKRTMQFGILVFVQCSYRIAFISDIVHSQSKAL